MIFPDDLEDQEAERAAREMPDMPLVWPAEPCSVCGKPGCMRACMHCGKPVCIAANDMDDSSCGGWIMDWWSNGACNPDEGNAFWCQPCLHEESGEPARTPEDGAEPVIVAPPPPSPREAAEDEWDPFCDPADLPPSCLESRTSRPPAETPDRAGNDGNFFGFFVLTG